MAFSKGGPPIETLVDRLRRSEVNPMTDEFLILNVAQANMRECGLSKHHKHTVRYYTFDHRRFWCMHQAGCTRPCCIYACAEDEEEEEDEEKGEAPPPDEPELTTS